MSGAEKMSDGPNPKIYVVEKQCDDKGMRIDGFDKLLIAVVIGIIFFILASPMMFKLSNKGTSLIGLKTVNPTGGYTITGLLIHTLIFIIVIRFLMH